MSEHNKKNPLEELYSDSGAYDLNEVVSVLKNFVVIQRNSNKVFLKNVTLTNEEKILAYALAKVLLTDQNLLSEEQGGGVSALEIKDNLGINKNTVDVTFMKLKQVGTIMQTGRVGKEVRYSIPTYKVKEVVDRLNDK
jgi:predicted transcriptional regulator